MIIDESEKIGKNCKWNKIDSTAKNKKRVYRCFHPDHNKHICGLNSKCRNYYKDFELKENGLLSYIKVMELFKII